MQIGLIGGIGPAATDYYYRRLIAAFAAKEAALELTIAHADTPTLLNNLASNGVDAQVAIYRKLTERLAAAGAGCVAVTSIAGHFCIEPFKTVCTLPVIDLISEVRQAVHARGFERIGILGARTVMETHLYGALPGTSVIAPHGPDLEAVHEAYVTMAASGAVTPAQRDIFHRTAATMLETLGAQAILLGGTDLALVFTDQDAPFPVIDCAAIHADAITRLALSRA
jgi:aspartate racemase